MKKFIALLVCSLLLQFSKSETIELNLKIFLEGPFLTEDMIPYLNYEGSIPLSQPYNGTPWNYEGAESVTVIPSFDVVDWVLVDLVLLKGPVEDRTFELVARKAAFILTDGTITDVDGVSYLPVNVYTTSGLYVCIHHRNHLSVISSATISETGGIYSYDFTASAGQTLGENHAIKELATGLWGMVSADGNNSGQIDNNDKNEVWLPETGTTGYKDGDFNLDNFTDDSDIDYNWSINSGKGFPFTIRHPSIDIDCGDSITDIRDGKKYKTVQIGNQCWMAQNLNTGLRIDGVNDMADNGIVEKYCFDDLETNCDAYGGLYQWDEVMSYTTIEKATGICPDGWHIPADAEWKRLEGLTDSQYGTGDAQWDLTGWRGLDAGTKLKSTTGWNSGGNGTDDFGFKAIPAGNLQAEDYFGLGSFGSFWTSTPIDDFSIWYRNLRYNQIKIYRNDFSFIDAVSLRCIKTQNSPPDMPANPTPNDGAVNINIDTILSWTCTEPDGDEMHFTIHFGTDANPPVVQTNWTTLDFNPGGLINEVTYYWYIVAYDVYNDSTVGATWSFTTRAFQCGDPLNDTRDNQLYNTILIGEQCWMAENLNIGSMIPGADEMVNDGVIEKYCYDNNTANCDTYGGLYQWNEMMQYTTQQGTQGICPAGWHLPTDAEWTILTTFLGGESIAGGKMKTTGTIEAGTGSWYAPNVGATNESGLTALPGGDRNYNGSFYNLGYNATFWSSTEGNSNYAWFRGLYYGYNSVYRGEGNKYFGFNVRCIKDTTPPTWSCGDPLNDARDGQNYNTVQIGEQCWMAENLNIGTMIPGTNNMANDGVIEKYCYSNNTANCDTYGGLYQWDEMMEYITLEGSQGICTTGWHLPSDAEWCVLEQFVDPTLTCNSTGWRGVDGGDKLKEAGTTHWISPNGANNSSGFTALPGGDRTGGSFGSLGNNGNFWSSSENGSYAWHRSLHNYNAQVARDYNDEARGFSTRCLKDITPPTWSCGDPLNDTRDGQTYNTVQIGEQCWMAENLNVGTMINGSANQTDNSTIEKYCYDNNQTNCDTYGGLYQWNEMMHYITQEGNQGICPAGWHLPTDAEWCSLTQFIDLTVDCGAIGYSGTDVGIKMKNTTGWQDGGNGTNTSGFTAIPGGYRGDNGNFFYLGSDAYFWSTSEYILGYTWSRQLVGLYANVHRYYHSNNYGLSVRCIKDTPPPTWSCGDPLDDARDGQTYNTVQIGEQCWMAENLNIGEMIPGANEMTNNAMIEKYCYDNNTVNCDTYGGLYQWDEMMEYVTTPGVQGVCPTNWHIPTDNDWKTLEGNVDSQYSVGDPIWNEYGWRGFDAGLNLKSASGWNSNGNGYDLYGFNTLPSGRRSEVGSFEELNSFAHFWTSTQNTYTSVDKRMIGFNNDGVYLDNIGMQHGFSIRCLKDTQPPTWSCGNPLNDARDGQNYNTVQIGQQCWMAENLNIGEMIPGANEMTNNAVIEKYCYDNNTVNCDTYGGLYQWNEMMEYTMQQGMQGICPLGWHIPTDAEYCTLTQFIDPTVDCNVAGWSGTAVGTKMKSTSGWNSGGSGTNTSGFTALPGGLRYYNGDFDVLGLSAYFWSSTEYDTEDAWDRSLYFYSNGVFRIPYDKLGGFSIRCMKD